VIAFLFVTFLKRLSDEDEYYVVCIVSFYELLFNPAVNNICLSFSTRESTSEIQDFYYYYYAVKLSVCTVSESNTGRIA